MSCLDVLRIDAIGTVIKIPVFECVDNEPIVVDISTATALAIRFKKGDAAETIVEKTGVVHTGGANGDGTDGIVEYVTEADFLIEGDENGKLEAYVIITFPDGSEFPSSIAKFKVKGNY